jgi:hypothetical protein
MKDWTEADDEKILHLISQGRTRKQIAVYFGVTRNAICGRVHRLTKPRPTFKIEDATPNTETLAAMQEADAGGGEVFNTSVDDAFDAILNAPDDEPKIGPGSRVVWSEKGRKMLESYYNRGMPKDGVFTVLEVIEWENSPTTVRIYELKNPTLLENIELAP